MSDLFMGILKLMSPVVNLADGAVKQAKENPEQFKKDAENVKDVIKYTSPGIFAATKLAENPEKTGKAVEDALKKASLFSPVAAAVTHPDEVQEAILKNPVSLIGILSNLF